MDKKERHKIAVKKWRDKNKEKVAIKRKEWRANNKDKEAIYNNKYKANHKETIAIYDKKYNQTPNGKKLKRIADWKIRGIIDEDIDAVYDYYVKETNCMICDKIYNKDIVMDKRCLDHDHDITDDNNVRYICCSYCNLHIIKA